MIHEGIYYTMHRYIFIFSAHQKPLTVTVCWVQDLEPVARLSCT